MERDRPGSSTSQTTSCSSPRSAAARRWRPISAGKRSSTSRAEPARLAPRHARAAMSSEALPLTVSTEWLAAHLSEPDLRVVDGTNYLPHLKRDAHAEYRRRTFPALSSSPWTRSPTPRRRCPTCSPRRTFSPGDGDSVGDGDPWWPMAARA